MLHEQVQTKGAGLEGVVVARSTITSIDGQKGVLRYRGIDINELCQKSNFEEVAYLLWRGKLPTREELASFRREMAKYRVLPDEVVDQLKVTPKGANPMEVARTSVSFLSALPGKKGETFDQRNARLALTLLAGINSIVAAYQRVRTGKKLVAPDTKMGRAGNFLYMLTGEKPDEYNEWAYDRICILYGDHEMNASTFALRVTVSTLADLGGGVTSAIGALAGPLHGGANQMAIEMIDRIGSPDNVERFVEDELAAGRKIMGFGHRVYKTDDPRALVLKGIARKLAEKDTETRSCLEIAERTEEYMWDAKKIKPNIEFYAGVVLRALGIPDDVMPAIFACNRIAGWVAHAFEQYADNRIIRPLSEYVGPAEQPYVPIDQRS